LQNAGLSLVSISSFLIRAASEAGLSELEIVDYSERSYKVENFLNRLFSR